jgi:hypothetical protein
MLFFSLFSSFYKQTKKMFYIVNVNAIDKDGGAERRDRERELMRSNSERDRSTASMGREIAGREFNDHHQNHRDTTLAKYSCRGEVNTLLKKSFCL